MATSTCARRSSTCTLVSMGSDPHDPLKLIMKFRVNGGVPRNFQTVPVQNIGPKTQLSKHLKWLCRTLTAMIAQQEVKEASLERADNSHVTLKATFTQHGMSMGAPHKLNKRRQEIMG